MRLQKPQSFRQQLEYWRRNFQLLRTYDLYEVIRMIYSLPRIEQTVKNLDVEIISIKNTIISFEKSVQENTIELTSIKNRINLLEQEVLELKKQTQMQHDSSNILKVTQPQHIPIYRILPELGKRDVLETIHEYVHPIDIQHCNMLLALYQPLIFFHNTSKILYGTHTDSSYHARYWNIPKLDKSTCEDALLLDIFQDELFCVVADGVSQSAYSNIAAQYVCALLHVEWKTALQNNEFTTPQLFNKTSQLVREALYQATYLTDTTVSNQIPSISDLVLKDTVNRIFTRVGSQATFACAFTFQSHIVCAWMGNTRIVFTDHSETPHPLLDVTDNRFNDDFNRFSSRVYTVDESIGMRGQLYVEIIPTYQMSKWQLMIFSDALESYKEELVTQVLPTRPSSNTDQLNNFFVRSIEEDDTSLITVIFNRT